MSHWKYNNDNLNDIPEISNKTPIGFVYKITNNITGKMYIGRKNFYSTRRKKVAGKKRREVIKKESDWKSYTGSNKSLNEDIGKYGIGNFSFEVLVFGFTQGQLNYLEEATQIKLNVLTALDKDENDKYYNDSIGSRKYMSVKKDQFLREEIKKIDDFVLKS